MLAAYKKTEELLERLKQFKAEQAEAAKEFSQALLRDNVDLKVIEQVVSELELTSESGDPFECFEGLDDFKNKVRDLLAKYFEGEYGSLDGNNVKGKRQTWDGGYVTITHNKAVNIVDETALIEWAKKRPEYNLLVTVIDEKALKAKATEIEIPGVSMAVKPVLKVHIDNG